MRKRVGKNVPAHNPRAVKGKRSPTGASKAKRLETFEPRLDFLESELRLLADMIKSIDSKLETNTRAVDNLFAIMDGGNLNEPSSGSLRSPLGRMSDEGASPIAHRSLKRST